VPGCEAPAAQNDPRIPACLVDLHDGRCYGGAVRLAVILLMLLVVGGVRAEDEDGEDPSGLSKRLRAIDDATEYEADNPEAVSEERDAGEDEADGPGTEPTLAEPGADPSDPPDPPARTRRTARESSPPAGAERGGAVESPIKTSPLERPPPADDEP
jgi:hypothetical protein